MIPTVSMRKALSDPKLLGNVLTGASWQAWNVHLIASMGEELTNDERTIFKRFTGRDREPGQRVEEFAAVKGRRAGGSRAAGVLAAYITGLCQHPELAPGERGVCLIIAPDQRQADIVLDYIEANFRGSPVLNQLVESRTARALRLTNHIDVEVRAADFRNLRGPTFICVIVEEVAFLLNDGSSNPDDEILEAVRPGLATTGGPLFLISSPYAKRGVLWDLYDRHFGPNGDPLILVAQGSSRDFNPTLPQSVVDRAYQRDPAAAKAEYGGEFRIDVENLFSVESVYANISPHIFERAPQSGVSYFGFVDPSGGSGPDSMTLAIGHLDFAKRSTVVDCLREAPPPFSPEQVCEDFSRTLRSYFITTIHGDRFAENWPVEMFSKFGIRYEQTAKPKSDLYRDMLPLINSKRVELLDHTKLINQICSLERRTARGGRESIDHAPHQCDDLANCVAGLCAMQHEFGTYDISLSGFQPDAVDRDAPDRAALGLLPRPQANEVLAQMLHGYSTFHTGRWR